MHEAKIQHTEAGAEPADDGWFILNLDEIAWRECPGVGTWCAFGVRDQQIGVGVHVLYPGDKPGFYHLESDQEGFLVLQGECVAVVEGEERRMRQWDYLHCPPNTRHITVGAGDAPCAILMLGSRSPDHATHYPVDPVAARHGASVERASDSPREVYANRPPITHARSPWPLGGSA